MNSRARELYRLQAAIIEIRTARDGEGQAVMLLPPAVLDGERLPTRADFRREIAHLTTNLGEHTVFVGGFGQPTPETHAEASYARNLELLTRGWRALLEYEAAA